jgi:hypothetical protein
MAAENAVLSNLRHPAAQVIDCFEVCDQLYVDFTGASHGPKVADTAYNLASADWFYAFNLPVGALLTEFGWVTHTTDVNNPTFAATTEDTGSGTTVLVAATAIGAAGMSVQTKQTAAKIQTVSNGTTSGLVKILGGTATNDAGIVTFYIKYLVIKRQAA